MGDIARDKDGNVVVHEAPPPVEASDIKSPAVNLTDVIAQIDDEDRLHFLRLYNAMEAARLTVLAHAHLYDEFSAELATRYKLPTRWVLDFDTGEITSPQESENA